jgi:hypothetical protein
MKYLTLRLIHLVCFSLAAVFVAANAHAQGIDDAISHVGIGVGITHWDPTNADGQTAQGITLAY